MTEVVVGTKLVHNFLLRELAVRRWLERILVEDLSVPPPNLASAPSSSSSSASALHADNGDTALASSSSTTSPSLASAASTASAPTAGPSSHTLWSHLKDGVLLCRVMLTLKPNSVPKIHEEKAEFRRKENLFFFLE